VGTVVSGEGSSTSKKTYNGKEYDYVFDIDIEDGKPALKLPYNLSENPWDAARRFLEQNELPFEYYEQVANWITDNTKGARLGQERPAPTNSRSPPANRDPLGTERRYRPGDAPSSPYRQRKLPQTSYQDILEGNAQNAVNKIIESSKELLNTRKIAKDSALDEQEIGVLTKLVGQINNSPRDPHPSEEQVDALIEVTTQWPTAARVPGVALLARLAVAPSFVQTTTTDEKETIVKVMAAGGLFIPKQTTANNAVHALRLFVNLFATEAGRFIMDGSFDLVLNLARPFASAPESLAQFKALATLYLNYSVLLTSQALPIDSKSREARAGVLLADIGAVLECDSPYAGDGESLFRTLCAIGTLLTLGNEFRQGVKMGVSGSLHFVRSKPAAQLANVQEVMQEIRDELK
jgi:phospholipase A-2-activating protein